MNNTTNKLSIFTGRLYSDPMDGDIAAQKEQTTLCPAEAASIKVYPQLCDDTPKPPGGTPPQGWGVPMQCEPQGNQMVANVPVERDETQRQSKHAPVTEAQLKNLISNKEEIWKNVNKKQGYKIATLNIRGRNKENKQSKWPMIATMMRKKKIMIMGVQETHLNEMETEKIRKMCPGIEIISNGNQTAKEGVAFIINKEIGKDIEWTSEKIIEGRALRMTVQIKNEDKIDLMVIYAPNTDEEKINFFEKLYNEMNKRMYEDRMIILGDFNCVENEIDRFPHREDERRVIREWKNIKRKYKMIDGWRAQNGMDKDYTFIQPGSNSMSRIDRIYTSMKIYPYGYNWEQQDSAEISDHELVTVEILKEGLPYIGEGIWKMQIQDIQDERNKEMTDEILRKTEEMMKDIRERNVEGIQDAWMNAKEIIKETMIQTKKIKNKDLTKKRKRIRNKIVGLMKKLRNENQEERERTQEKIVMMKEKMAEKSGKELLKMKKAAKARYREEGEKYTKYWFKQNAVELESQIILRMQKKDGKMTRETKEMMEIALEHHRKLQEKPEMNDERQNAIEKIKKTIKNKINENEKEELRKNTSYEEIKEAIRKAPSGKTPGTDGIIYEFYKQKMTEYEKDKKKPDMIGILSMLIEDIEKRGLRQRSNEKQKRQEFTDGMMNLIYKKKEKWKIENYRPITLLNTDYKTYTKTIALRLAKVAKNAINEDQAGFVPGRSIYDQTKMTNMAIEYCEMIDKNGCIVALDQEKAYDKIDHEYLWQILTHYGFPMEFIGRIRELYKKTRKAIVVNGVVTKQYEVQRGVHQGDPMSCLLYNFAIEPLADAVRESKLKGMKINEKLNRLLVSLFADDTLVYLSEKDEMKELEKVIENFCQASTAKFNKEKTEYLPIGNEKYRRKVIETRKICGKELDKEAKIIREGEAMRTLGAWVGNKINNGLQWEGVIRRQEEAIEKWGKANLTLKGKEIILKAIVQSKATFLATVNGMPKEIEKKMKRMFKDFIWNGKRKGLMSWEQIITPREQGGLGMPDIRTRLEAIEIMWVKKWLAPESRRPKWAYVMDEIINKNISKSPMVDERSRISWIKQSWHENENKMTNGIRGMLKTARKYNINLEPLKYDKEQKEKEVLWHNRLMTEANYQWNKKSARCLREKHKVETIGDLNGEIGCSKSCESMINRLKSMIPEIIDPTKTTPKRVREKNLDLTPRRLKRNEESVSKKIFNPNITARGNILDHITIFGENGSKTRKRNIIPRKPAYREKRSTEGKTKAKIMVTVQDRGKRNQEIKVMVKMSGETKKEKGFKLREKDQSEDKAYAMAVLWTLQNDKTNKLTIVTRKARIMKWLGEGMEKAEEEGWSGKENVKIWKRTLNEMRKRANGIVIRIPRKKEEIKMKKLEENLKKNEQDEISINFKEKTKYVMEGAKLEKMTQKIAYEKILERRSQKPGGENTARTIEGIIKNLEDKWNIRITQKKFWRNNETIKDKKMIDMIWKIVHNRIKCGKFFAKIPGWEEKKECKCGQVESMEHILLKCKETGQEELWEEIGKIWKKITGEEWKELTIWDVMGIGSIKIRNNKSSEAKNEVLKTMVTTAIWTIWINRNIRIFEGKIETAETQKERWKEYFKAEVEIEYELINQTPIEKRNIAIENFTKKWMKNKKIIRIEKSIKKKRVRKLTIQL